MNTINVVFQFVWSFKDNEPWVLICCQLCRENKVGIMTAPGVQWRHSVGFRCTLGISVPLCHSIQYGFVSQKTNVPFLLVPRLYNTYNSILLCFIEQCFVPVNFPISFTVTSVELWQGLGLVFWLNVHWSLFLRAQWTITGHWFRQWLDTGQATSHYLNQWWFIHCRRYASLGLNELHV